MPEHIYIFPPPPPRYWGSYYQQLAAVKAAWDPGDYPVVDTRPVLYIYSISIHFLSCFSMVLDLTSLHSFLQETPSTTATV